MSTCRISYLLSGRDGAGGSTEHMPNSGWFSAETRKRQERVLVAVKVRMEGQSRDDSFDTLSQELMLSDTL